MSGNNTRKNIQTRVVTRRPKECNLEGVLSLERQKVKILVGLFESRKFPKWTSPVQVSLLEVDNFS